MIPTPEQMTLSVGNVTIVAVVAILAAAALGMSWWFRAEVLRADEGTPAMQVIAKAIQEGASAFLTRQFRTLGGFAAAAFVALFLLPAHSDGGSDLWLRVARSGAFLAGAGFSALIGYLGMWLAVRANVRVAAAAQAREHEDAQPVPDDITGDTAPRTKGAPRQFPTRKPGQ